jgi:hypothetical protein
MNTQTPILQNNTYTGISTYTTTPHIPKSPNRSVANTYEPSPYYQIEKTANTEALRDAFRVVDELTHDSVKKQAKTLLDVIEFYLNGINFSATPVCIPPLHLYEQDDGSATIEWIFDKRRIGFILEQDESKSFYYYVEEDREAGSSQSYTRKIRNSEYGKTVLSIIDIILKNN